MPKTGGLPSRVNVVCHIATMLQFLFLGGAVLGLLLFLLPVYNMVLNFFDVGYRPLPVQKVLDSRLFAVGASCTFLLVLMHHVKKWLRFRYIESQD